MAQSTGSLSWRVSGGAGRTACPQRVVCVVKGASPPHLDGVKGHFSGRGSGGLKHADLGRIQLDLGPACLRPLSLSPCPDSGTQPGGVPSAPTGPLGPPGHGQTLGKSEGIRAG